MVSFYQLGPRLGIDPGELLAMVNGKKIPTKAVLRGLAKELDVDERYLEKLAGGLTRRSRKLPKRDVF
jgi:transcriptional regulator with XRE-family HTH domain